MKIYIITSGDYSAYSIRAVFTNKEKAEETAKIIYDSNVEEWESDVFDPDIFKDRQFYSIWFDTEGNILLDTREKKPNIRCYKDFGTKHLEFKIHNPPIRWSGLKLSVEVLAINEDHAKKIACDFRRQLIAENKLT